MDSTRVMGKAVGANRCEHRGRILGITDRATSAVVCHQLPNKLTAKGPGGGGPEVYEEIKEPAVATIGPNASLCVDGAKAWKKLAKKDLGETLQVTSMV